MSNRKFALFCGLIFLLGALPLLVAQPSAAASAGLSLGFTAPLADFVVILLTALLGLSACLLPRDTLITLPACFMLMVMLGGLFRLGPDGPSFLTGFALGALICVALLVALTTSRRGMVLMLAAASFGFQAGAHYVSAVPEIAAPIYYLLGVQLSLTLMLAIAIAFGVTLISDHEAFFNRLTARFFRF
jgi:urease accessory protein